jgi:hypothetical protein
MSKQLDCSEGGTTDGTQNLCSNPCKLRSYKYYNHYTKRCYTTFTNS